MAMKVTGHLKDPMVEPCPGRNDVSQLKDDQCRPAKCTRQPDWTGLDCCQYWKKAPNVWDRDVVHVDQLDPERFEYNKYRYQIFAKPSNITPMDYGRDHSIPDKRYVAPDTDIRALRHTMYIPVTPSKPGGVTEFTYPMTPQTMNDPDVTTACCVPVIPCNPGFQNLTPCVRADPNYMCQTYSSRNKQPMQIGPRRADVCSEIARAENPLPFHQSQSAMAGHAPEFVVPPSNQPGGSCLGLPGTFPDPRQLYATPFPPQLHAPHYLDNVGGQGCAGPSPYSLGIDVLEDGINAEHGAGAAFTSVKSIRYKDRVARAVATDAETPEQRACRLKSMYGAFGSYLVSNPYTRRHLEGVRDSITQQGNGFAWSYPRYENRLCYIVERNPRC